MHKSTTQFVDFSPLGQTPEQKTFNSYGVGYSHPLELDEDHLSNSTALEAIESQGLLSVDLALLEEQLPLISKSLASYVEGVIQARNFISSTMQATALEKQKSLQEKTITNKLCVEFDFAITQLRSASNRSGQLIALAKSEVLAMCLMHIEPCTGLACYKKIYNS